MNLAIILGIVLVAWWMLGMPDLRSAKVRAKFLPQFGAAALFGLAFLAVMRGHYEAAIPMAIFAAGLIGKSHFFPGQNQTNTAQGPQQNQTPPPSTQMSAREAYEILGLPDGAGREAVKEAHRRLIKELHPDRGGSAYLSAKINTAKDMLLRILAS